MKLKEIIWQIKDLSKSIGSSEPYICGGVPRDKYMGRLKKIADIDITTGDDSIFKLGEEFSKLYSKTVQSKISNDQHRTMFFKNIKIDFSSNFNTPNIDYELKKLNVQSTSLNKEMFSRDFTCNSLLLSTDLKTFLDPTKRGLKDIDSKVIDTCLDPSITLTTNNNRVCRAVYLSVKLGFSLSDRVKDYILSNPDSMKISTQNVMTEKLNKAFEIDGNKASKLITDLKLWGHIPITEVIKPYYLDSGINVR